MSGRAAQKIALKLKQVSAGRQVICVTHLAQIAAQADCHLLIQKTVREEKTYTQVDALDFGGAQARACPDHGRHGGDHAVAAAKRGGIAAGG